MSNENVNEAMVADSAEKSDVLNKFGGKSGGIIGAIAVVLIALIVRIGIYNTPANRLARQLDLGNRYLDEQNYEQASIAFDKAIAIDDRCMEAYEGGIKAYQGLGDQDGLTNLYERALEVTAGLEETELDESMESVVAIYLATDDVYVYGDNPEKVMEILEEGYAKTGSVSLNVKIEEYKTLQAQEEEAAKAARKAEAHKIIDDVPISRLWWLYCEGHLYLSDIQIRELYEPMANVLESYLADITEADLEDWLAEYCLEGLSEIYYMLGEYDLCMEKRWQCYEAYGSPLKNTDYSYTPTEHTEYHYSSDGRLNFTVLRDEYGRKLNVTIYWEDSRIGTTEEYEYGENGKCVKNTSCGYHYDALNGKFDEDVYTFEYDSSGRLFRETRNYTRYEEISGGRIRYESYDYEEYEYHEGGFTQHNYTSEIYSLINPTNLEGGFYCDFVVDQYGDAKQVGDYYGYYGSKYEREALEEQERNE